jgi:hypothetical protein
MNMDDLHSASTTQCSVMRMQGSSVLHVQLLPIARFGIIDVYEYLTRRSAPRFLDTSFQTLICVDHQP